MHQTIGIARNLYWGPDNQDAFAKIEMPKASRGEGYGEVPIFSRLQDLWERRKLPSGVQAKPRPLTSFSAFELEITHTTATNLTFLWHIFSHIHKYKT